MKILNFISFYIVWFLCVGAASVTDAMAQAQAVALAAVVVLITGVLALWQAAERWRQRLLGFLAAVVFGVIGDLLVCGSGMVAYRESPLVLFPGYPWWVVTLWGMLVVSMPYSLAWFVPRGRVSMLFGLFGGAASMYAGYRLQAVEFPRGVVVGLVVTGCAWAILLPVVLRIYSALADKQSS